MSDEIKPVYQGEAQLVRWADSGAAGRTITLRIDEHTDVHPFKGLKYGDSGQRFEIAVVAKNDDEEPLDPEHAKKNAKRLVARKKTERDGPLPSNIAAIKCKEDQVFRDWLCNHYYEPGDERGADDDEGIADRILKRVCGISSKKELDVPGAAQAAFDKLLATYDYRDQVRR